MGFFSQDCEGCGHPALSIYAVSGINDWMQQVVAISPSGSILKGIYDGYGRLQDGGNEYECAVGWDNTIWHAACWKQAGSPTEYRGQSKHSDDQGFFFDDGEHDMEEPCVTR